MKRNLVLLTLLTLFVSVLAAHPHFRRTSTLMISQGQELTLSHVTYPWNEANPERFPAEGWTPGASLETGVELTSGSTSIPAGKYNLKLTKDGNDFVMHLVQDGQTYTLDSETVHGLSMQDHLMVDVHVTGDSGYLDVRYGTFLVRGQIKA